jgi:thiosulfate reductase cytochrome b subunit
MDIDMTNDVDDSPPRRPYTTLAGTVDELARRGFTEGFRAEDGRLRALGTGQVLAPDELVIVEYHRFEGVSDPDDMAIVYAIESTRGVRGTVTDAYGVYADPAVNAVLADVPIHETSPVPSMPPAPRRIYRHALATRLSHWLTALCLPILIMSGLQIFNGHPALYWGNRSDPGSALLQLKGAETADGATRGITEILGREIDTTGLLGASRQSGGDLEERGFPSWATLPGARWLAMGRRWHFFFAWVFVLNGLGFGLWALVRRHLSLDLWPTGADWRGIGRSVLDHLRFRHPTGAAASRYNVLQKVSYLFVIFGLAPLVVATGLAMSPSMDALIPWLPGFFGGRQAARTVHFAACFAFVGFVAAHLFMVAVTGLVNNLRSMVTGWYRIDAGGTHDGHA